MEQADKWDLRFIRLAEHISQWSKDPSTPCGAVIFAPDRTVVSLGFNGLARGIKDSDSRLNDREEKYAGTIHAEVNAILFANRTLEGCTMAVWPFLPCHRCSPLIVQKQLARVIAPKLTSDMNAERLERWRDSIRRTKENFMEAEISYDEVDLSTGCYNERSKATGKIQRWRNQI